MLKLTAHYARMNCVDDDDCAKDTACVEGMCTGKTKPCLTVLWIQSLKKV